MSRGNEVVITGIGVVSPLGIGADAYWSAMTNRRSGVGPLTAFDPTEVPVKIAGQVPDFDPKQYVQPRKSLKVMIRDTQFAVATAAGAIEDARLDTMAVDPERFGVVYGADRMRHELHETFDTYRTCSVDGHFDFDRWGDEGLARTFPLGLLKILPNMPACHISIIHDARGPNNTLHLAELSGLLAIGEAASVIERGWCDCMIAGASSSRLHPLDWVRSCLYDDLSRRNGEPAAVSRPFDADRDGQVRGEGAASFVLESRKHAESRGARILGRVLGWASAYEPRASGGASDGSGVSRAIRAALASARLTPQDVGHVNANAASTRAGDRAEARALNETLPDVPVTAPKSFFGNLLASTGAVEMVASLLSFQRGEVPVTLNYQRPDDDCPVQVVHCRPLAGREPVAVLVNQNSQGQTAAMVIAGPA